MAYFLAVANRKGGVGKSTVAVMLAQAFAIWGGKKVLILDLDSQCNASLILLGGAGWRAAEHEKRTIGHFFEDRFDGLSQKPKDYLVPHAGDVSTDKGGKPPITLLPGSLLLEDIQNELLLLRARLTNDPRIMQSQVIGRMEQLLKGFAAGFDVVVLDCAPGLSAASATALKMANKVVVPFRPDYVSQFAVDRVAQIIEGKTLDGVLEIPFANRRYVCLANFVRDNGRDQIVIDTVAYDHPLMAARLPHKPSLADAFDWLEERVPMRDKYRDGLSDVRKLYDEAAAFVAAPKVAA